MSTTPSSTIGRKVWIGVRFVLFGFVGFGVMLYSALSLILTVLHRQQEIFSPNLAAPLTVVGALMIVYGVGEWKRWAYVWVFPSIPTSLFLTSIIPGGDRDKGLPVVVAAIAAFSSSAAVRAYYARKVRHEGHEDDQDS
jgi:hypothetical protein